MKKKVLLSAGKSLLLFNLVFSLFLLHSVQSFDLEKHFACGIIKHCFHVMV